MLNKLNLRITRRNAPKEMKISQDFVKQQQEVQKAQAQQQHLQQQKLQQQI